MTIRVLALCGGIGGVKLALGMSHIVAPENLAILVNTGDDFEHLGLTICPDVDTVTYTLAGLNNTELGWGLAGETWAFMDQLKKLGGEDWFNLGDRDLALHVERTRRLNAGESLAAITGDVAHKLGIAPALWPMSDDPVRTVLDTDEGTLEFQRYFVGRQAQPAVSAIRYDGGESAAVNPAVLAALADPALEAVIICPSNPWLSIAPLLAMPALREALSATAAPVIAVSPIVGGKAIKGPTAKLMGELGLPVTASAVAEFYRGIADAYVLDQTDAALEDEVKALGMAVDVQPTVMTDLASKQALARQVLAFAERIRRA